LSALVPIDYRDAQLTVCALQAKDRLQAIQGNALTNIADLFNT